MIVIATVGVLVALGIACCATLLIREGNDNDRHKRRIMGYCFYCGYDMRATPTRCPECGRASAPRKTASK